jgi:cytochrome d ubiquinol oxidase subunit I
MRTAEAVTPMPGLVVPFLLFTLLYIFLATMVLWLLMRQIAGIRRIVSLENPAEQAR